MKYYICSKKYSVSDRIVYLYMLPQLIIFFFPCIFLAVGYYDDDDVPDFLVKYQYGPGYPVYQYEQTVVLSGKDGSKISRTLTDSIGSQSSPISISLRGRGNDIFIHWLSNCKGHDKEKLFYSFPKGILLRKKKQIPAEFLFEIFQFVYMFCLLFLRRIHA